MVLSAEIGGDEKQKAELTKQVRSATQRARMDMQQVSISRTTPSGGQLRQHKGHRWTSTDDDYRPPSRSSVDLGSSRSRQQSFSRSQRRPPPDDDDDDDDDGGVGGRLRQS